MSCSCAAEASLPRHEFVYCILSHGKLDQALRLMRTIRMGSPESAILIHHDAKSPPPDDSVLRELGAVSVKPRVSATWGDFSLVEAMRSGIHYAREHIDFDWLVMLSGQDYPLRPIEKSEEDLRRSPHDAFVRASPVMSGPYAFRYYLTYWKLPRFSYTHRVPKPLYRILEISRDLVNRKCRRIRIQPGQNGAPARLGIGIFGHPFSCGFVCHKGSQWLTLSRRATDYLCRFEIDRPDVMDHYRQTLIPDESYFQTILCNASELRICDDHRRFILWDDVKLAHPVTLSMKHFHAMVQSGKDFGRKFDMTVDAQVLDALDSVVLASRHSESA
jgi:hypothetical protein